MTPAHWRGQHLVEVAATGPSHIVASVWRSSRTGNWWADIGQEDPVLLGRGRGRAWARSEVEKLIERKRDARPTCGSCFDEAWVCECGSGLVFAGVMFAGDPRACPCGGAGMPCPACNDELAPWGPLMGPCKECTP